METNNKILEKEELLNVFFQIVENSGFVVTEKDISTEINKIKIKDTARKFELHFIVKNISYGGRKEKEDIKRIQVGNIKDHLVTTNRIRTHMLCGIINYEGKNILVVWNSYLYTNHTTNRSCYIHLETIKKCAKQGYLLTSEFDQEIWLCDETHFGLLIRDYINFIYIGN